MEGSGTPCRVGIAVLPRLLADTLARALARCGVDVVVFAEPVEIGVAGVECHVVLVGGAMPAPVGVSVVIRLPEADDLGVGSVTTTRGRERIPLHDVDGILDVLDRYRAVAG